MIYLCFDTAVNGSFTLLKLQEEYPEHQCLFKDTKDASIWDVAPWLFLVSNNVYRRIDHPLAQLNHVVLFESNEKIDDLRLHLQEFIYKTENGQEYFFRFWDARVLTRYLSNCTSKELETFFGEVIQAAYFQDGDKDQLVSLTMNRKNRLEKKTTTKQVFFKESDQANPDQHKDPFAGSGPGQVPVDKKSQGGSTARRKFLLD